MLYREGVGREYSRSFGSTLAAYYLWECGPETPEWKLWCGMFGRAVHDIGTDEWIPFEGWFRRQFTFWDTYDFLVWITPHMIRIADADPLTVLELLIQEYDEEWVYDLLPNHLTGMRGSCVLQDNPGILSTELFDSGGEAEPLDSSLVL